MSNDSSRPSPEQEKILGKTTKQSQEATEMDLWDLDSEETDALSAPETPKEPAGLPQRRKPGSSTIQSRKPVERHIQVPAVETIKVVEQPEPENEIELETGSEPEVIPEKKPAPSKEWEEGDDETTEPQLADKKPKPSLASLSKMEKIATSCLVAALALGATLTFIHFSNRVPTRPLVSEEIDYPVAGKIIEITSASTYWRKPITTGENTDVVRRGTELIPVLKMNLSSKSGAIRVFFRNDEGLVVGDGITRAVSGESEIAIASTAGFEDIGMHTAYRTGDSLPWVVQVFEGPATNAPREKFRKILETEISPRIR